MGSGSGFFNFDLQDPDPVKNGPDPRPAFRITQVFLGSFFVFHNWRCKKNFERVTLGHTAYGYGSSSGRIRTTFLAGSEQILPNTDPTLAMKSCVNT